MSTFCGKLNETQLDFIGIDRFTCELFDCSVYFLSHAHSDHMIGIQSPEFQENFNNSKNKVLYASPLTITFLKRDTLLNLDDHKLIPLTVGFSHNLQVKSKHYENICVTLLPARHCPGSVMILIEVDTHRILYTGDFRVQLEGFKNFKPILANNNERCVAKRITSLYLDTTFASEMYFEFPTRNDSCTILINAIKEWLQKDEENKIVLFMPAYIGVEFAVIEVAKYFKEPIHVHKIKFEKLYGLIPELSQYVTPEAKNFKIHACTRNENSKDGTNCCLSKNQNNIKYIQLSALAFTSDVIKKNGYVFVNKDCTRVCYSSHASCKELREIVKFLSPEKLFFNVIKKQSKQEIFDVLTTYCKKSNDPIDDETLHTTLKLPDNWKWASDSNSSVESNKRMRFESPDRD
ncbi:protein artemis-like isoform X1 [Adelges cooleyi]|uniref:protein artemis-like isoform X1 n=1 Tax=Adelges cooleyi TaxID=133065 RepID=UPI00217FB37A|nr:protein artemis-like isoform X1 [Adelges cooleyi]